MIGAYHVHAVYAFALIFALVALFLYTLILLCGACTTHLINCLEKVNEFVGILKAISHSLFIEVLI